MIKSQIKLLIVFLLSSFLISFNAQAFHSTYQKMHFLKQFPWDKDKFEKGKEIADNKKKYCATEAKDIWTPVIDARSKANKNKIRNGRR